MQKTKPLVNKHYFKFILLLLILIAFKPLFGQKITVREDLVLDTDKELLNSSTEWFSFNKSKEKWQYKNSSDNFYFDLIQEVNLDEIPKNHKVISLNQFYLDIEEQYRQIHKENYQEELWKNMFSYKRNFRYSNLYIKLNKENSIKYYKVNFNYQWTSH
ncbi:hypothetical protein HXZ88_14080 [Myroides odoratimimus]|uniref:hypothetical protein n=1 Tax=Myroides odoratimimus TaxID=76832 RepID=UPI0025753079|nr:hypothetical protein [Myroides odoratimimus]MDM1066740.1 hypothetical protein [Myroides odoratimimus]MEC4077064.1 hypothetical protein [Myroides odoratimimus]